MIELLGWTILLIVVGAIAYHNGRKSRQREIDVYAELLAQSTRQTAVSEARRKAAIEKLAKAIDVIDTLDVICGGRPKPAQLAREVQDFLKK